VSEWWTYTLQDFLLFSPRTYYRLFELYNRDIWPAQILTLGAGVAIVALPRDDGARTGGVIAAILAGCWLWVAWGFHYQRYATINWAAVYFAAAFAVEALLLIWTGVIRGRLEFGARGTAVGRAGLGIVLFALVVQPLIGLLVGREWIQAETFGVAPDPTVLATLGILLLAGNRVHWELLLIPVAWCAITGATLWAMGSPDAPVMPLAALLCLILAVRKTRLPRWTPPPTSRG
jgi:Family of unknown function (DUF6064)